MKNKINKELKAKGFIRIRNVLNFQKDIKPVLNDLEAKADKLIEKYFTTKEAKRLFKLKFQDKYFACLLYTSPSPRDNPASRMPSSA